MMVATFVLLLLGAGQAAFEYDVFVRGDSIVLTSVAMPNVPTFRLTYEPVSSGYAVPF
jgi:hypothetical protein